MKSKICCLSSALEEKLPLRNNLRVKIRAPDFNLIEPRAVFWGEMKDDLVV